jgi:phospholipid transport system substrate-binding protein
MSARRIELVAIALALLLAAFHMAAVAGAENAPLELVRSATQTLLAALDADPALRTDPSQLQRLAERYAAPRFDFVALARLTLGKHWRTATAAQQRRFTEAFRRLLVRTYSVSLAQYSDQRIEYQLLKRSGDGRRASVRSRILSPGAAPIVVDYGVYDTADGWKIYDVSIEGVSLVNNYRSGFSEEIRRSGLDALIARLDSRNAELR